MIKINLKNDKIIQESVSRSLGADYRQILSYFLLSESTKFSFGNLVI